ncbi:MAG: PAS domain S-box protein [Rhodospirillaceae bacterium]|nr:PAS domain S-box protein [Rhodospirillaceae bacterium]
MTGPPPPSDSEDDLQSFDAAELFRACFDSSISLMAISTLKEGRHVDVNDAWLQAFGYTREEVIGKNVEEMNIWADLEDRKELATRLEKEGFIRNFQATLLSKTGAPIYCDISASRLATGTETYLLFSGHDLTKTKKLEEALRKSEKLHQVAAQQAKLAFWRWTFSEGKMTDWSPNYQDINAYGDSIPESYEDMLAPVHPDDKEKVIAVYNASDIGPSDFDVEYRVIDDEGRVRCLKEHGEVEYDEAGNPVAHVGILLDITDLKTVQDKLRHSRDELERLVNEQTRELGSEIEKRRLTEVALSETKGYAEGMVENTAEGMITIDDKGVIETFNPAAQRIFGYKAEEAIGNNVSILLPEEERLHHDEYVNKSDLHASRIINKVRDLYGRHKNGTLFPMELNVSRMPLKGQTKFIGILHDISDRKNSEKGVLQAREQAETANRAKSELLANMSHELRTPLNAVIGFSQMFLGQIYGPLGHDKYLEYAMDINTSSAHLLELINDILDVSAIEAGKLELNEDSIDLKRTIEAMRRLVTARASKDGISITFEADNELPHLSGDERRIKQILLNLLSNAVKFTKRGGRVDLKASVSKTDGLMIAISDTGIGMSKEDIARAIDKFGQVDSGLNRKNEGTGLGLPLTISLVELHGGTLDIESQSGVGTTITIRFPADRVIG